MKQYLTISEFAKLRNVNLNSIRYYEKQNILIPAWIDPQTKYRYYLPEQLGQLDMILLCLKLGIPLKELKKYIDEHGKFDEKGLLQKGKQILQERILDMQSGLEITEFNLNSMEQNSKYCNETGIYTRQIEERYFIETPFQGNWNDILQKEQTVMDLFRDAQKQNLTPVFPAGLLIRCETNPVSCSFYLRILHPSKSNANILHIPEASFSCLQIDLSPQTNIQQVLEEHFSKRDLSIAIISNMILDKFHFSSRHSEIQIPLSSL